MHCAVLTRCVRYFARTVNAAEASSELSLTQAGCCARPGQGVLLAQEPVKIVAPPCGRGVLIDYVFAFDMSAHSF